MKLYFFYAGFLVLEFIDQQKFDYKREQLDSADTH
jgi:hypothetical protein